MKNIITKITALSFAILISVACTGEFDKINDNDQEPNYPEIPVWIKVGEAVTNLQNQVIPVIDNPYQMIEVLGAGAYCRYFGYAQADKWSNSFAKFNAQSSWVDWAFTNAYNNLFMYYGTIVTASEEGDKWNSLGKLLMVAGLHRITDIYGPIPYSEIDPANTGIAARYDSQATVYATLLKDLDSAIDALTLIAMTTPNDQIVAKFDGVYKGDMVKWVKFANSLKLRIAMRMSFVDPVTARKAAEEAVAHSFGVILSNDDNAILDPNKRNPLWRTAIDYDDNRAAAEIICYMDGWKDPRLPKLFTKYGSDADYLGLRIGAATTRSRSSSYSNTTTGEYDLLMWLNAAEVAFNKAEAALNGWTMGDTAENLYNKGIELSFAQHGVSAGYAAYVADGTSVPTAYTDNKSGGYKNSYAPSPVWTLKVKWGVGEELQREQIATQKWLAIYPLCNEAWAEMRRTGYPRFFPSLNGSHPSAGILQTRGPSRLPFPFTEARNNTEYYNEAVTLLGGVDDYTTRLWWDTKVNKPGW